MHARVAVGLYGGVILVAAVSFTALYVALTRPSILGPSFAPQAVARGRLRFGVGVAFYGIAFGLSWLSPIAALGVHGLMAAYYLSEQATSLPSAPRTA
jgi:hypothetical protein